MIFLGISADQDAPGVCTTQLQASRCYRCGGMPRENPIILILSLFLLSGLDTACQNMNSKTGLYITALHFLPPRISQ